MIFDQALLLGRRRDQARSGAFSFLRPHIVDTLREQVRLTGKAFGIALEVGATDARLAEALRQETIVEVIHLAALGAAPLGLRARCDQMLCVTDGLRLPFGEGLFDAIFVTRGLELVEDLPAFLGDVHAALKPDGRFFGIMLGAETFRAWRQSLQALEEKVSGGMRSRFHPQINWRAAGDLLSAAGFCDPVVLRESVTLAYGDLRALHRDLRLLEANNALCRPHRSALPRSLYLEAVALCREQFVNADGDFQGEVELLWLSGSRSA